MMRCEELVILLSEPQRQTGRDSACHITTSLCGCLWRSGKRYAVCILKPHTMSVLGWSHTVWTQLRACGARNKLIIIIIIIIIIFILFVILNIIIMPSSKLEKGRTLVERWNITLFFRTGICGYSGIFFAERDEELAINKLQQRFEICGCGIPIRRDHKIRTDRPLHGVTPPVTLPAVRSYAVVVHYNSWSYIYIDI